MSKVFRKDKSKVETFKRTPQGFLQSPAFVTRSGIFEYRRADGSMGKEFRPEEEVFKAESLATLAGCPVTNDHPTRLVDVKNIKDHAVGHAGDIIERDGIYVKVGTMTIYDEKTIADIESGKVEVSCGYECDMEESPGVYQGESYDMIQKNIVYNHISVVDEGRAGPQVRLRLDAKDAISNDLPENLIGDANMEKIKLGDKEFEVSPELKAALDAWIAQHKKVEQDAAEKLTAAEKKAAEKEDEAKEKAKKADTAQALLDAAIEENKKIKTDSADVKVHAMAVERVDILKVAGHVLGSEIKLDAKTNMEIKRDILAKKSVDVATKSDDYVNARFDAMKESVTEEIATLQTLGASLVTRTDSVKTPAEARKASMEASKNAWKENK